MKKILLFITIILGLSSLPLLAQGVNLNRYITLTVQSGKDIRLNFRATQANTPVRIVSGTNTQDITVGTNWYSSSYPGYTVTANATTMKIYGDITSFKCASNNENLTGIDVRNNTDLKELICNNNHIATLNVNANKELTFLECQYCQITELDVKQNTKLNHLRCFGNKLQSIDVTNNTELTTFSCANNLITNIDISKNTKLVEFRCANNKLTDLDVSNNFNLRRLMIAGNPFTTEVLNNIYCTLPIVPDGEKGLCEPVYEETDANLETVMAANSDNARAKNWDVKYAYFSLRDKDVPNKGDYECPYNRSISLFVTPDTDIKLDFKADAPNSIVRIKGGDNSVELTVGTSWYNGGKSKEYTFRSTTNTITITGAVHSFNCSDNGKNLKAISVLYNKSLNSLFCNGNDIKEIDLRNNHKLTTLECANNYITNLDLTNNTYLSSLNCSNNQLTDLNVTVNNLLTYINANDNLISVIDVTNNDALEALHCSGNQIPNINLTKNTKLKELSVARNQLKELDLDDNKALIYLHCEGNELAELDLAANVNLKTVYCYDNLFDTLAVNRLYCSLPAKESDNKATIYPLNLVGDSNGKDVAAATSNNAREKNWNVRYAGAIDIEVPSKGKYDCKLHPNMKRFITLHVAKDKDIMLNFASDADITPIRIMSGKNVIKDLTIGTVWYDLSSPRQFSVNASDSILTIYGNITKFSCADNKENVTAIKLSNNKELTHLDISNNNISTIALANAPEVTELYIDRNPIKGINLKDNLKLRKLSCYSNHLTALDLSANTEIKKLYCYDNPFNTDAVNNLYCSLPYTKGKPGICYTLNTTEDTHHEAVVGATSKNARRRNWEVKYFNNDYSIQKDIPSNGNLVCDGDLPDPNMGKYITLTVTKGKEVKISMRAAADSTTVRVVNGTKENDVLASTDIVLPAKEPDFTYTTEGTTLTFYGDINRFECIGNEDAITGIDVSNNPSLVVLFCQNTKIEFIDLTKNTELEQFSCSNSLLKSLDVSKNTKLSKVNCNNNKLTSLNVSNNTELTSLFCNYNKITTIDISNNTKLGMFHCAGNKIGSIDFSNNTELGMIWCYDNNLTSLDLSNNKKLNFVQCHGNPFNTEAMNKIYCLLPEVESEADFYPLDNEQDANHAAIVEATSDNARGKKWKVQYFGAEIQKDVPSKGGYDCKTGKNSVYEYTSSGITVFPNPAYGKVQVNLDSEVNETLILVDLTGRVLLSADVVDGKANIDVSNLTAGTYFIRVGNRVQKLTVK